VRCAETDRASFTFRNNQHKAGRSEIGSRCGHDFADTLSCLVDSCECCYDAFGSTGICLVTIGVVGLTFLAVWKGAGLTMGKDCIEICSYDDIGQGICRCLFGG
jgi:hypothetical protein